MTDNDPAEPSAAPPIGLVAFSQLAIRRRLSPAIRESVYILLAERGQVWTYDHKRFGQSPDRDLTTEAHFDRALGEFLERVPGAAAALADRDNALKQRDSMQARVDAATRERERRLGFKGPQR